VEATSGLGGPQRAISVRSPLTARDGVVVEGGRAMAIAIIIVVVTVSIGAIVRSTRVASRPAPAGEP
jgi:hypothetical protein